MPSRAASWSWIKGLLLVVLLLAIGSPVSSQGFSLLNGRNHPEIEWLVAETEHFQIVYPQHLAGIEVAAGTIAEDSYRVLSELLSTELKGRVRIYLSDEDEIANGVAVPFGNGYTAIWVHAAEFADIWTGDVKWLRKVIAHELVHLFQYAALRTPIGNLGLVFAGSFPRDWTEGLAQYLTEEWDAQRGDRWLRTAMLEDRLNYLDGQSAWNGNLLYAVGNSQVRYMASQYGDSTLTNVLKYRNRVVPGLLEFPSFAGAFRASTGVSYGQFRKDWRRHMNLYYGAMAAQMENIDSLDAEPYQIPGQYHYDAKKQPGGSAVASVILQSLRRPIRQLIVVEPQESGRWRSRVVAEGSIKRGIDWSPDGKRLAYTRSNRGRNGSIVNDLFLVDADGRNRRRLTYSRRASHPTFNAAGDALAFVGSGSGSTSVFRLDLSTLEITMLIDQPQDVQITGLNWSPDGSELVLSRFSTDGSRHIAIVDIKSGRERVVGSAGKDYRYPVWSPDGKHVAFTSLEDDVPNVFVARVDESRIAATATLPAEMPAQRVTWLATGAEVLDWLPGSDVQSGRLLISATQEKERDALYLIDADRRARVVEISMPDRLSEWTRHRPKKTIAPVIRPDDKVVEKRRRYRSVSEIDHLISGAFPYFASQLDYGIGAGTLWMDPLGKHQLGLGGSVSLSDPENRNSFYLTYVNTTLRPTLALNVFQFLSAPTEVEDAILFRKAQGAAAYSTWQSNLASLPYHSCSLGLRLRAVNYQPLDEMVDGTLEPSERGAESQTDLRFRFRWRHKRPYVFDDIHPLDGFGVDARLTVGTSGRTARSTFLRPYFAAYSVVPGPGASRFYVYGRGEMRIGDGPSFDNLGLSRYDPLSVSAGGLYRRFGYLDRVRGNRTSVFGRAVAYESLEYRVPLTDDLQTRLFGLLSLENTGLAFFADAGSVWDTNANDGGTVVQTGLGVELRNIVQFSGFRVLQNLGVAVPGDDLSGGDLDVYYRITAAVPF